VSQTEAVTIKEIDKTPNEPLRPTGAARHPFVVSGSLTGPGR